MSRSARPALVSYYVDADVLGLAKILVQVRGDVTYPGDPGGPVGRGRVRPPCTIVDPATCDEDWIPETARQDWLIITRDRHIQEHRAEVEAVRVSGARMIALSGADAVRTFDQLEALLCNWRAIERKLADAGPFRLQLHPDGRPEAGAALYIRQTARCAPRRHYGAQVVAFTGSVTTRGRAARASRRRSTSM
jgi:hypothetical protein